MEHVTKAQIKLVRSLQQKKYRDENDLFVAEGDKCVEEIRKAFPLVYLFREGENATRTEIEQMSSLRTPQGVIGVFRKNEGDPKNQQIFRGSPDERLKVKGEREPEDLIVALDGVQDPGNLGTIIRTCDWFGVRRLVCSRDTADCFNPKVVQATMGALARVRVEYVDLVSWIEEFKIQNLKFKIVGTLLNGHDLYESPLTENRESRTVIVMGNEGNGISETVRRVITDPVRIPSYPKDVETSESLNVSIATAIILAELRRNASIHH